MTRRIRRDARSALGPLGVTPAQTRALRTVARADGPVRMSALADQLGIARRSTTDIVGELVERALVARVADPCDRRGVAVELTGEGRALLDRLTAGRRAATESLLAGLTPAERDRLADLLRHLLP